MIEEIILKKDVEGLGGEGDIKKVAAGYARNFLLPFGHAVINNKANLKKLAAEQKAINQRKTEKLQGSKGLIEKLEGVEIDLEVNASEEGKLFGSITQLDIVNALKEKGYEIDKKQINLPNAIKTLGKHDIDIKFYGNLFAKIKIAVNQKEK